MTIFLLTRIYTGMSIKFNIYQLFILYIIMDYSLKSEVILIRCVFIHSFQSEGIFGSPWSNFIFYKWIDAKTLCEVRNV